MHEILRERTAQDWVLDLGCRGGSFAATDTVARVVRLDLAPARLPGAVAGDATRLPFPDGIFSAVIANHSLEHIDGLSQALGEIGRVLAPTGALYIAVPDASTLCDRLYRWLARGGGHINAITDPGAFAAQIAALTRRPVVAQRTLYTSFSYLHRENTPTPSLKMRLLGGGREWVLRAAQRCFAYLDRSWRTRLRVYGWAFYAGRIAGPIDITPRRAVCLRCGAGHEAQRLAHCVLSRWSYRCPACGTTNARVD